MCSIFLSLQSDLHAWLWRCRYACAIAAVLVYGWAWLTYRDIAERNARMLEAIQRQNEQILDCLAMADSPRSVLTPRHPQRYSWPQTAANGTPLPVS